MTKKQKIPESRSLFATTPWTCTNFGNTSEIDAYIEEIGTWKTIAETHSIMGIVDAEDVARFIVDIVNEKLTMITPTKKDAPLRNKTKEVLSLEKNLSTKFIKGERPSCREIEVMEWTAQGKTYSEIAMLIGISQDTVKTHIENFRRKVDATNKTQAVTLGILHGLIKLPI